MRCLLALLLLLTACPSTDPPVEGLALVAEELPEALLSVRATASNDVWIVGADQGEGPAVLQWDGADFIRHDSTAIADVDLWWVHPTADAVWLAGSGGFIGSLDRDSGAIDTVPGPDPALTFFGLWGASADDLWAVGAAIGTGDPPAIWRNVSGDWAAVDLSAEPWMADGLSLFKVHGSAADDVWIVGSDGLIVHWDGAAFTDTAPADLDDNLLTVELGSEGPIVVGGLNQGLIFEWDGSDWSEVAPDLTPALNGICQGSATVAVGRWGGVARKGADGWALDSEALTLLDYHACLTTDDGAIWAVGGHISSNPLNDGLIAYEGPSEVPSP